MTNPTDHESSVANPERHRAFVIMPHAPEFDAIYSMFIREALTAANLVVTRSDDIQDQANILSGIVAEIGRSDIVVADLTGANPNVFYELGLSHAMEKRTVLLTQDINDVPFDLKSYRMLVYGTHFADVIRVKQQLTELATGVLSGKIRAGNPVTDFLPKETAARPAPSAYLEDIDQEPVDDRGVLDHAEALEKGYLDLTGVANNVASEIAALNAAVERSTTAIQRARVKHDSKATVIIRAIARELANRVQEFSKKISDANDEYQLILWETENSLEFLVRTQLSLDSDDQASFVQQLAQLAGVQQAGNVARNMFTEFAQSIDDVPPLERELTRSLRRASAEVRRMADNMEQTVASISRAIEVAERLMAESS